MPHENKRSTMLPQLRKIALRLIRYCTYWPVMLLLVLAIVDATAVSQNRPELRGYVRHGRHDNDSVYGGQQPISGAHVYIFAINESGYGLNPISLLTTGSDVSFDNLGNGYVTSRADGGFSLTGRYSTSTCPTPGTPIYLLALGGDPGVGSNNPAIALVSALSVACGDLPNAGSVAINELTTVAAAFSLSAFANPATNSFASSSMNLSNLQQGFTAANVLVNSLTGVANPVTQDKTSLPVAKINTMADILAACMNTTGTTPACNTLFAAATPPGGTYPVNTLQAAFGIAENVTLNVNAIFNLLPAPADAAFEPTLTWSPTDWTISAGIPTTTSINLGVTQIHDTDNLAIPVSVNCNSTCGTVEFRIDGIDLTGPIPVDGSGNAMGVFPGWLGFGPHVVQAFFGGNPTYAASNSNTVTIQILFPPGATPTSTVASTQVPQILAGQQLALDAQVSCNTNCGYVIWYLDGIFIGTGNLDATGNVHGLTQPNVPVGIHTLVVQYPGDANDLPSTSAPVSFTVSSGSQTPVYSYAISSYQPNGNVQAFNDSVNGSWSNLSYDSLSRLTAATQSVTGQATQFLCWSYDSFGNRLTQTAGTNPCASPAATVSYNSKNQITFVSNLAPIGFGYDEAGDVTNDGLNEYLYDAEGRVCAVGRAGIFMTQYVYDAEGQRVAKGSITSWSCDTTSNGFMQTNSYVLGPSGEQVTEMDGNGNWLHTNVYAAGQLIATYTNASPAGQSVTPSLHFHLADWLGTNRVQLTSTGESEQTCQSLLFGDTLNCAGVADATEHHFTGKERDSESGLDYFGARYYASSMGRFMSPDWAAKVSPVPYAKLDDPQSLNLYAYVRNNPLSVVDTDGHELIVAAALQQTVTTMRQQSPSFNAELSAHEGANSPNLTINFGATPNDPGGQPSIGNTSAMLQPLSTEATISRPDLDGGPEYQYKGATVTINDSISGDSKQVGDTLGHEVGHVHDARTNTNEFGDESHHTAATHGKTPHDQRPEEKTANAFKDKVNAERKATQKEQKHDNKDNQ